MWFLCAVLHPFVSALSWVASGLARTNNLSIPQLAISEEEIRSAIAMGEEQGVVEEEEAEILHNVFEFGDRPVREIMTPRTEVTWLELGTRLGEFDSVYAQSPHTHYPVYQDNTDNVVGVLSIKDVLMAQSIGEMGRDGKIDSLVRSTYFVPETKHMGQLLSEMQAARHRIAIIVDEFGGISGVVTLEQLVEEIVGDIRDDTEIEEEFTTIDERTFDIDGGLRVDEANEEMSLGLPPGEDYDTVAGFILDHLGRIPRVGAQFKYKNLRITVTEMSGMKIERVRVIREEEKPESSPDDGGESAGAERDST
jgi:CBS domain containing-hemolysin-like protein